MRAVQQRHCGSSALVMTMLSSPHMTLLRVQLAPSSIWKRRSPCSSACCVAQALRVVTIDHDDVVIATGDVAACAAGAELDLRVRRRAGSHSGRGLIGPITLGAMVTRALVCCYVYPWVDIQRVYTAVEQPVGPWWCSRTR